MGLKESGLRGSIRNVSTGIGAAISIDTLEAENVEADSATIRGEITELTNFGEDAEVFFEWGEDSEGLPNTTDIQLQDTVGVFTEDLTNLSEDTTHEFQAFGSVRDVSDDGVVLTFETGAAIPDSVVHQFKFDEGTGSTANDSIGSLSGAIDGANYIENGFEGGFALDFDDSDSVDISEQFIPEPEFSVAFTIEISSITDAGRVFYDDGGSEVAIQMTGRDRSGEDVNSLVFSFSDNTDFKIDESELILGDKMRVCAVGDRSSEDVTLHVNGTDATASTPDGPGIESGIFTIGNREPGSSRGADQIIDNFISYNEQLTQAEVEDDFNAQPWS